MPSTIDQSYNQGYSRRIHSMAGVRKSKLADKVRMEKRSGEVDFFDRFDDDEASEKLARLQPSPAHNPQHSRRMVTYREFQYYPILDHSDQQKTLTDPKSQYVKSGVSKYDKSIDQVIVDSVFADAKQGKTGATLVPFPASQKTSSTGGLTKAKLIEARSMFGLADADESDGDGSEGEPELYLAYTQYQINDLLNDSTMTSADFNNVQPLVTGKFGYFMGFWFVKLSTKLIPKVGAIRRCFAWQKNGLLVSKGEYTSVTVERADLSRAWQVQNDWDLGATRMEEERVVEVQCTES